VITEPYKIPLIKIIENNSLKDITYLDDDNKFRLALHTVTTPLFRVLPQNHPGEIMRKLSSRKTTVVTAELIEAIKTNMEDHEAIYQEALVGYELHLSQALQALEEASKRLRTLDGADLRAAYSFSDLTEKLRRIEEPKSYTVVYAEALKMFTWTSNTHVDLSTEEFRALILNKWDWTHSFLSNNSGYSVRASAALSE